LIAPCRTTFEALVVEQVEERLLPKIVCKGL